MIPLLSPKPLSEYSPEEYLAYVRTLYVEPERAAPPADFSVRLNKQSNPVITVRRKPKWLIPSEVSAIATELGWPLQKLWLHLLKKKIIINVPKPKGKK